MYSPVPGKTVCRLFICSVFDTNYTACKKNVNICRFFSETSQFFIYYLITGKYFVTISSVGMDIKQLLEELARKVKDPSFSDLAQKFRTTIRTAQGYTADEKRGFYTDYKHLWDERKAWLENRKKEQEQKIVELDYLLDVVDRLTESTEFSEQAHIFEREFKRLGGLAAEKKEKLWERFQTIWQKRRDFLSQRKNESGSVKNEIETEIVSIDYEFNGAPDLKEDSQWDKIGGMMKASRDKLREIRTQIENDSKLMRPEKRQLYELIESVRDKIKEAETRTFENHGKKAEELYQGAKELLEIGNIGDAAGMLKHVQSQIRMLWLKKGEKERYLNLTEELWGQLKDRRKERKQQFVEWLEKQKEGLDKLRVVKQKAEDALERIRKNIEENRARLTEARSDEFIEKVNVWIAESEAKEKDILGSVNDLQRKIAEIEDKLKKHGMI